MYNQIYNITNEFVKSLTGDKCCSFRVKNWNGKRGPKRRLSLEKGQSKEEALSKLLENNSWIKDNSYNVDEIIGCQVIR